MIVVALTVVENTIPGTPSKFADDSKLCVAVWRDTLEGKDTI